MRGFRPIRGAFTGGASAPARGSANLRARGSERGERGVVLIWFALMLIMLMGFAGFAVDLSNWWFQAEKIQRSADAGAHAGAAFLPGDLPSATTTARSLTGQNGFTNGSNATVTVSQEPNPNRLRVKVKATIPTYFVGLLGVSSVDLTREAVAEYVAPVPMGSPENKLGNDPARAQNTPQFWINIAGPNATKKSGDRFQAKFCATSVANCTGTVISGINNDEYATEGYFFALKVASVVAGQPLNIQVYDPAMTYVNDTCGVNMPTQSEANALQALPGNPYPDGALRFAPGLTSWCTGDQDISGRGTKTTFIVRGPDATPWSDLDNPVVAGCTKQMPSFDPGGSNPTIYQYLHPTDGKQDAQAVVNAADGSNTFAELFRQNVTICSIPAGSVSTGEYILQVRSNSTAAAPTVYSASVVDGGHNRMSIFAGFGSAGLAAVDGSAVSINARGRLPIYANATAANTSFYLARVLPYDAGRTLRVTLFDIGDAASAGVLQILPPAEFAATFSGCVFSRNDGATLSSTPSTCTLSNVSSANGFDGRSVTVDIPIPANYTCTPAVATQCWIKVRAAFPSGVTDTTTWSAAILGNPIRLVE